MKETAEGEGVSDELVDIVDEPRPPAEGVVLVVEYMPEGHDHWLVCRGAPGESFTDVCEGIRHVWRCPCLFRLRE